MKPFNPTRFAPSALDERFDAEMLTASEVMPETRCTVSEIEIALGGGPLDKLDAAAFADPCRRYPLPQGPLSMSMIRARLQLLLFRDGTSDMHEHMESVFGIAPIEDREAPPGWEEKDCSEAEDLDLADEDVRRLQGLTKRLWNIAMIHEPFVREMLEGYLGWALILGIQKFGDSEIAETSETVADIVEEVAPLWLFADLQMGGNAGRLRRGKPSQMPFWADTSQEGIPRLFRAIKEMEQRLAKFERVRDIYYRDLRRPVGNFAMPASTSLSGSNGLLGSSSSATLTVTLFHYGKDAAQNEVASFEADGTADEARGLLAIWRKEHADQLEAYIEFRMKEAERELGRMRKRLERLREFKGLSNLDLSSYNQTMPRARLFLACEQAAAWLPPPVLPAERKLAKGRPNTVVTEYKAPASPIRRAINATVDAVKKFGPNADALTQAKICPPAPKRSTVTRARALNYLFANLIVEGKSQDELLDGWDEGGPGKEQFVRRTQADRLASRFRKQFKKQTHRARHHEVLKEARGSLEWRFRQAGVWSPGAQ